jgi:hypothetical protein
MTDSCGMCRYWLKRRNPYGTCHRHAPEPVTVQIMLIGQALCAIAWAVEKTAGIERPADDSKDYTIRASTFEDQDQMEAAWPDTRDDEWCGEFAGKPES